MNKELNELQQICLNINVWENWKDSYENYVPKFIEEAKKGNDWTDWTEDVFNEFFIKSSGQCVSSLQQGYFTNIEKDLIKQNWNRISPLLKNIACSQDVPLYDDYTELKNIIRQYTNQNRKAATNRLIASLQPNLLSTVINEDSLRELYRLLNKNVENFDLIWKSDWFENSYNLLQFFKNNLETENPYDIVTLPWQVYDNYKSNNSNNNDMSVNPINNIQNILKYKKQIILQGPPGTGKTREAKYIAKELLNLLDIKELDENDQFKILQFHPSYTYEDFVRGIVAESKGEKIEYKNVNKALGLFAEKALKNFYASSNSSLNDFEIWIDEKFEDFKNQIEIEIEEKELILSGDITLYKIESDNFRYGKQWATPARINFIDFKKLIKAKLEDKLEISNQQISKEISVHAHYRYTYYNALLKIFFDKYHYQTRTVNTPLKNYVLIIDEINRANLSSVLGELIYALEYRGEAVESMYEVDGDNKLILPPNLYIIGTMNTADRSVGHIDYAIRRRFAFVDVLPKDLSDEIGISFDSTLFHQVSELFETNLSPEFEKKDVQLGHSYFIQKKQEDENGNDVLVPSDFNIRLEYEIKPILLEYVKDGVLIGDDIKQKIEELETSI